ncbi:MAG: (2Fe-2S)-binding protein [bacterium]|jgi:carbon-monoxide dehydrogenase small subunit|nr:(2Fe-2S)-binding protein [bacterium]
MDERSEAPARRRIALVVNGNPVEAEIEPRELLLDFLRHRLGLMGAKRSCDVQVCGSCTVLLDGEPVSACCTLAYEARDRQVLTIEGLADAGRLHVLQEAFIEHAAVQCGFCTSGMILTSLELLREVPAPVPEQVRSHLKGNLCRCTGYRRIIDAVVDAGRRLAAEGASS